MSHRPDPRFRRPRAARLLGLAAMAGALAALGCAKSPLAWTLDFAPPLGVAGKPVAPNAAPASPRPALPGSAAPTASPGGPASVAPTMAATLPPTTTPSAEAIAPDDPLPPAGTDSDLAPAEEQAVEQALASEDARAYLPAELIHDGGVVLYRTLAAPEGKAGAEPGAKAALGPPPRWKRADGGRSGPQLVLRRACPDGEACAEGRRPVRALVRYQEKGAFSFRAIGTGLLAEKKFGALFSRVLLLKPEGGTYRVDAASPISVTTSGGRAKLEIAQVSFFGKGAAPLAVIADEQATFPAGQEPRVVGGDTSRLEVDLVDRAPDGAFVFLTLPGAGPAGRLQLRDDGQGADATAGDGRYSASFVVPNRPGLQHAVIDVVDPRSFLPNGPFRSNSLGLTYRADVKER